MLVRIVVCVALILFCVHQAITGLIYPSESGGYYISMAYIAVPVLLLLGLNRRGLLTWPIASLVLLLKGHWIVGWVPVALVLINIIGNALVNARSPEDGTRD